MKGEIESMNSYLSPSIEEVIPLLMQTCDDLTKEVLIRELTRHTQELCVGDPELAEAILEGKKTLPECVRFVLEKAAAVVAKNVEAMTKGDFESLPKKTVRGKSAQMAGSAISTEDAFKWADQYYYGGRSKGDGSEKKKATEKKPGQKPSAGQAKKAVADTTADGGSEKASADPSPAKGKTKGAMAGGEQITMAGFCDPPPADTAA